MGKRRKRKRTNTHSPDLSPGAQKMGYPSRPIHIQMVTAVERGLKAFGRATSGTACPSSLPCLGFSTSLCNALNFPLCMSIVAGNQNRAHDFGQWFMFGPFQVPFSNPTLLTINDEFS